MNLMYNCLTGSGYWAVHLSRPLICRIKSIDRRAFVAHLGTRSGDGGDHRHARHPLPGSNRLLPAGG